jgi:hypothetical protein
MTFIEKNIKDFNSLLKYQLIGFSALALISFFVDFTMFSLTNTQYGLLFVMTTILSQYKPNHTEQTYYRMKREKKLGSMMWTQINGNFCYAIFILFVSVVLANLSYLFLLYLNEVHYINPFGVETFSPVEVTNVLFSIAILYMLIKTIPPYREWQKSKV